MGHRVGIKRRPRADIDRRPQGLGLRPPPFHVGAPPATSLRCTRWSGLLGGNCGALAALGGGSDAPFDRPQVRLTRNKNRHDLRCRHLCLRVRLRPNEPPEDGATLVNAMGNLLLGTLMTICELGKEWRDATKIPAEERLLRSGAPRARRGAMSRPRGRRLACRSPVRESRTYALPVEARCAQVCVRSSQVSLILR